MAEGELKRGQKATERNVNGGWKERMMMKT